MPLGSSSHQTQTVTAIIPAAGSGKRFGPGRDKPFHALAGKPVIAWSLEKLQLMAEIAEIIPVLKAEDTERGKEIFERYGITKVRRIALGGRERQDSVYHGLRLIEDAPGFVLIHDAARPLADTELVRSVIREMVQNEDGTDGVIPGLPVTDTIKEARKGMVRRTLKRDDLWAVQTPQIFLYRAIASAYERAREKRWHGTDDAALVEKNGGRIKIIVGSYRNIKITTPEDLVIAEALIREDSKHEKTAYP